MEEKKHTEEITLNEEQMAALERIREGGNYFISGKSGTGKTTLIKRLSCLPNAVFLAPTGNAAQLINGMTIHSFFRIPPLPFVLPEHLEHIGKRGRKLIKAVETVVIDEISMVRADIMDCIDLRLRQYAPTTEMSQQPFGGRQIIVSGDFFQLPPVVSNKESIDGKIGIDEFLEARYIAKFPFASFAWRKANIQPLTLKQSMRQAEDADYATLLDKVKTANPVFLPDILAQLNTRVQGDYPDDAVVLCTTNAAARHRNETIYRKLDGEERVFYGKVTGNYGEDPSDEIRKAFKVGMRVIATANQYPSIHTGDAGIVVGFCDAGVVVHFDSGIEEPVKPFEKARYIYVTELVDSKEVLSPRKIGSFTQIPLLPGYAITVHRSQGMTLGKVLLDLRGGCFASGQAYVGLSRCRSLGDLYLTVKLRPDFFIVEPEVVRVDLAMNYDPLRLHDVLYAFLEDVGDEAWDLLYIELTKKSAHQFLGNLLHRYQAHTDMPRTTTIEQYLRVLEKDIYDAIIFLYTGNCDDIKNLRDNLYNFGQKIRCLVRERKKD